MPATHPHPSFHFSVEAGLTRIGFARVQLPCMERDVIRYREGTDKTDTVRLLPGLLRLTDCVLERGVTPPDNEFFRWLIAASLGPTERRDVSVTVLDAKLQPSMVWRMRNTFPVALDWSVLDAQSSSVLIETLRLGVESMEVETV